MAAGTRHSSLSEIAGRRCSNAGERIVRLAAAMPAEVLLDLATRHDLRTTCGVANTVANAGVVRFATCVMRDG